MLGHGIACVLAATMTATTPSTYLAAGDGAWATRAAGHRDGTPQLEGVTRAIDAYQAAVDTTPTDLEAQWKLLRALWFAAEFGARDADHKRTLLERGKETVERALAKVAERGSGGARALTSPTPEAFAPGDVRAAAHVFFWSAITLGTWTRTAGLLAAVRAGVANRMHVYLNNTTALDPNTEQAGPLRVLSRLHAELPKVPFLSGWVDRDRSLPLIERAFARYPGHPGNRYLLGVTLLEFDPARRDEGLRLIAEAAAREPDPDELIEQWAIRKDARERLDRLTEEGRTR